MRYSILVVLALVTGCANVPSHAIPPYGGEMMARKAYPNSNCRIISSRLGPGPEGRGLWLTTGFKKLPHGSHGEDETVHLRADCCNSEGQLRSFTLSTTPRQSRYVTVPDDFFPKSGWLANPDTCREMGLRE